MSNTHSTLTSLFSDIADEIRAKKGTSADIIADNFPTEIASIPAGGGSDFNPLLYATTAEELFQSATLPHQTHFTFGGSVASMYRMCRQATLESGDGDAEIKISKVAGGNAVTNLSNAFYNANNLKRIVVDFDTSHVTNWVNAFYKQYPYGLREVVGELDFSAATNIAGVFYNNSQNTSLKEMRLAKNTLAVSGLNLNVTPISDDSCVSIANGLNESAEGKTVGLPSKISTILGTSALDTTGTYHIFTADASGTMTLSEFITTVKGWTLV